MKYMILFLIGISHIYCLAKDPEVTIITVPAKKIFFYDETHR